MDLDSEKKYLGKQAVSFVKNEMVLGLGTGSTVEFFLKELAVEVSQGLNISAVASSIATEQRASELNIPLVSIDEVDQIDLVVDGADEIDLKQNMIKGGGAALLREKILIASAKRVIIIADNSKKVDFLGKFPLPVEITPYGHLITQKQIHSLDCKGSFRLDGNNDLFVTDNGNYLFDITNLYPLDDPLLLHERLISIPGVVETGLFCDYSPYIL